MDHLDPTLTHWINHQLADLHGSTDYQLEPLKVEASHREFYRITLADRDAATMVAMSSPPALENNQQFEAMAKVFTRFGVGVPQILAVEPAAGFYLMTDLGSVHLEDLYDTPQADSALQLAIDELIKIQAVSDVAVPAYTAQRFHDELDIFRQWFIEAWLQQTFPNGDLQESFTSLVENSQTQQQVCIHRDFHCRNLLVVDHRLGVVDFQDALMGPVAYDLASLLRDCYHRFNEADIARWRARYLECTPLALDPAKFAADVDLIAAQRQLKAVGIFARLQLRDGKTSHLGYIPPVLSHIESIANRYPQLRALTAQLPAWRRAASNRLAGQR